MLTATFVEILCFAIAKVIAIPANVCLDVPLIRLLVFFLSFFNFFFPSTE